MSSLRRKADLVIAGEAIAPGETRDLALPVSERFTGAPVQLPVRAVRAEAAGPTVFVTAALHGDELNGVGIVRDLMIRPFSLQRGTVLLLPMVNVFGMEARQRYMPDRRDLNRSFPGSARGSLASRVAHTLFSEIVENSDYGIDLHTAAVGRTNFPHVRADMSVSKLRGPAEAFGSEVIINQRATRETLRTSATRAGCSTLVLESGEALKIEPGAVALGTRGVLNVLRHLRMIDGELIRPAYQAVAEKTVWVRAPAGGLLRFHVAPGAIVGESDAIATVDNLLVNHSKTLRAPVAGIVIGMTTFPAVKPGDPVAHIALPTRSLAEIRAEIESAPSTLHRHYQREQAKDLRVEKPPRRRKTRS